MTITEANDVNAVLHWAMSRDTWYGQQVTDATATAAARRLTARAHKALAAGLHPAEVELTRAHATEDTR